MLLLLLNFSSFFFPETTHTTEATNALLRVRFARLKRRRRRGE